MEEYRVVFERQDGEQTTATANPVEVTPQNCKFAILERKLKGDVYDTVGQLSFTEDYVDATVTDTSGRRYIFRSNVLWQLLVNGIEWKKLKKFAIRAQV